jgi:hypothetical protein
MAKAYAQKISLIQEALGLKRVDEKPTMPTVLNEKPTAQSTYNVFAALERSNGMVHEEYIAVSTAQESTPYLGSDDGLRGCPHWQQHPTNENVL